MIGHGEKLTLNQEKAISALLSCPSVPEAAKSIRIGEATIFRWLKNEDFQENYRKAKRDVVDQAISQVQASISSAVKTLKDVMDDKDAPASAKVSAARAIIDTAIKAVEIQALEDRITKLEKILTEKRGGEE